ncbi:MAG: DNA translocase FtsK, partial [Eubacteriales bacterium]
GYFSSNGFLVSFARDISMGLVGAGFYILPPVLLCVTWLSIASRKKPVVLRIVSLLLLPLFLGSLLHLFVSSDYAWSWSMFASLYKGGVSGTTGGILGGILAMAMAGAFSDVGAIFILILALIITLLTAWNITLFSLIRAIQNRPRPQKVEEKEDVDRASVLVNHVANKHIESLERREVRKVERQKRKVSDFDIPVDGEPLGGKKSGCSKKAPDEVLKDQLSMKTEETIAVPDVINYKPPVEPPPVIAPPTPPIVPIPVMEAPVPKVELPPLDKPATSEKVKKADAIEASQEITREIEMAVPTTGEYLYPPTHLLKSARGGVVDGTTEMRENTERLNGTLQSFGIDAHIVNVTRGPSVTRYELELDRGVKLSKLTNLADDIALSLGATGVRISAIPNKISVVGIEVPNRLVSMVSAREVLDSTEFSGSKSKISFGIGKDIGGNCIVGDIARLPHMLIAGTTGSGKSVCMNSLIISLLYKARPDEVRLIMVDPKMVELGIYNGIPHLLIPVVTDPKKAAGALQWAVTEMLRRYRMMADAGVRDLDTYNKQVVLTDDERKPMEQIVVVIDELADLMLVAAKEVEESICRIAQMGRASGIHLVIATQRPSADVITGLMKANIPSRIAFAVASAMESRIILDTQGAEKLVGKGDMLYAPLGQGKPKRVQGCFITDEEVQEVVNFIKTTSTPNYSDEVQDQIDQSASKNTKGDTSGGGASVDSMDSGDEMLPAAVEVFLETNQASVSMLQRRLKLGYARAARIMDEMEDKGFVGPSEGSKPRQMLITKDQWEVLQNGGTITDNPPVEDAID